MNKRASEKINAAMYILYLVIIAGGVTILTSSYLNTPVDIRSSETQILYNSLINCFSREGFLSGNVMDKDFNVFTSCHISETAIVKSNIYFEFNFLDEKNKAMQFIYGGNSDERNVQRDDCEFYLGTKTKISPSCLFKNETYLYYNGTDVVNVKIAGWVASNNQGARNG